MMKKYITIILIIIVAIFIILWQKNSYEDKIVGFEDEIFELSSLYEELQPEIKALDENNNNLELDKQKLVDDNKELVCQNEKLEEELSSIKYRMIKDNLPEYWHGIWENIYNKSEGELTSDQIEEINFLLQPTFSYDDWNQVNPLGCFFTSYYKDARDINLADFLRYFPYGEVPEELPEFEELKDDENWPFQNITYDNMPVPIHRYKSKVVQDIFVTYAGISLNELTGVGFDGIVYLKSTDSYYNFTSDFGPGFFTCTGGTVENGTIKLYRNSRGESKQVLTIVKIKGKFLINSFYNE
jgi:regulator of replication initiation timing